VNYLHSFHAGNPADVLKHALLVRLVRALQRKEKGFVFVDTHAGRGAYDLSDASEAGTKARKPEWPEGIGRLWDRSDAPAEVLDYLEVVRGYDRSRGNLTSMPRFYPGSPRIVRLISREQDRLELWEKHPAECAALRSAFSGERRVSFHEADGYGAMKACLPPAERRGLVLIDPPYESADEWREVSYALAEGIRRFPGGTYAIWYPLTARARVDRFLDSLKAAGFPAFTAELVLDPDSPKMQGCGVVVANPPWRFDAEARSVLDYLGHVLARAGVSGDVRWIVDK
jgi:23S rRNA (adenine2030-N6)-methyltransferase